MSDEELSKILAYCQGSNLSVWEAFLLDLADLRKAAREFLQEEDLCEYGSRYWTAMANLRAEVQKQHEPPG